jgi:cysteine desulfurase
MIYLDNNATTRPSPAVAAATARAMTELWANPSSVHRFGQSVRREVELARQALADLVGVKARELTFTSGGTEAIDLCIRGVLDAIPKSATKRGLVTTRLEHSAVRDLAEHLARDSDTPVRWLPILDGGIMDVSALPAMLDGSIALVSVQWANNETGVVQPVHEIAAICQSKGVLFHCDATQWFGKMPALEALACDLLTFSPHKFHGPKGVGVAWMKPGVRLRPRILGSQELGRRGGTENVAGILGAGVAAAEALAWLADPGPRDALRALRDRFETLVLSQVPDAVVNGAGRPRLWNTTNIGFPQLEAEALLMLLSERGVCASAGAACSSGSLEPSPVLLAMGVSEAVAHGSVRFSLSKETTPEDIEGAAKIVAECVGRLRVSMP